MKEGEARKSLLPVLRMKLVAGTPCTAHADGIGFRRVEGHRALEADLVLPQVAKVVFVAETRVLTKAEIRQADLGRVISKGDPAEVGEAIVLAMDDKAVEVRIAPVEDDLQAVMEIGDGAVTANEQASSNHRADFPQPDVELVGLDRRIIGHHEALHSMRKAAFTPWMQGWRSYGAPG